MVTSVLVAVVAVLAVALVLAPLHRQISPTTPALSLLLVVLVVATRRGLAPGLATSFAGMLGFNYFFLPPVQTSRSPIPRTGYLNEVRDATVHVVPISRPDSNGESPGLPDDDLR